MEKCKQNNMAARRFTDQERRDLKKILQPLSSDLFDVITDELEHYCHLFRIVNEGLINRTEIKNDKKQTINRINRYIEQLKQLHPHLCRHKNTAVLTAWCLGGFVRNLEYPFQAPDYFEKYMDFLSLIEETIERLEKIRSIFENSPLPPRKNPVDPLGLVTIIAQIFQTYFKEPRTYKDTPCSERAPFPNVVKICLNAVGIPIEDVDRHVKAAIKNL